MADKIDVTLPENLAHQCVKCSACRSVCPTYSVVKQERSSPRGRLALAEAVVDGFLPLDEEIARQWNECAMCRRCEWICPNEVEYKEIMFRARHLAKEEKKSGFDPVKTAVYQGLAMTGNFITKTAMKFAPSLMDMYGKLFKKEVPEYNAVFLNTGIPKYTKLLPKPTAKPFGLRGKRVKPEKSKGKLLFFTGCMIDAFYGKTGESVMKLMEKAGYEVIVPENIRCCGAPQLYGGEVELFEKLQKHNKQEIDRYDFDYIVVACPTCGGALEEEYGYPVKDFAEILKEEGYLIFKGSGEKVTFHFPCHSYTAMSTDPDVYRTLLKGVVNAEYVEGEDAMMCCGFAGYFSVSNYDVATQIQKRKVKDIESTQAQYVLSDCPGCVFNIADGMYKHGDYKNIKVVHLADYLAERLTDEKVNKKEEKEDEGQSIGSVY